MSFRMRLPDEAFELHDGDTYSKRSTGLRESAHLIPSPSSQDFEIHDANTYSRDSARFPESTFLIPSPSSPNFEIHDADTYNRRSTRFQESARLIPSPSSQDFEIHNANTSSRRLTRFQESMHLIPSPSSQEFEIHDANTYSRRSTRFPESARLTPSPSSQNFETHDADTSSRRSPRFQESTHLIPSPSQGSKHKPFEPLIMKLPVVIGTPLLMLGLGIGLEIAIFLSKKYDGFKVPRNDIFHVFHMPSQQFIVSFFPTLLILPFAITWRELDWNLRWYQPYVVLQKGNAVAEESLLLDYVSLGPVFSIFRAVQWQHQVIFWSSFTATLTYLFQPLVGSIFQIQPTLQIDTKTVVTATKNLIYSPNFSDLHGFMAAAGYVDASVIHGLKDPPFVDGKWATVEVIFPHIPGLNGTLNVTTYGVQSNAKCTNPSEEPVLYPVARSPYLILSSKSDGCERNVTIDPNVSGQQYGVDSVICLANGTTDVQQQPVMFWYYNRNPDGTQQVQTVFCTPTTVMAKVQIVANASSGGLASCQQIGEAIQPDHPMHLNGLFFNFSDDSVADNPINQLSAIAIKSIVPGAVFRAAQLNGSQPFGLPNDLLNWTSTIYTRHLSMSAKSIYFVDLNTQLHADVISLVPRLKVEGLPAHPLAFILVVTGIIGIFLHIIHRRERKRLLIATPPGSIASVVALTSRSGFGKLLLPYDDKPTLEKKLDGLRFRLDQRTGAILAEDQVGDRSSEIASERTFLGEEGVELMDVEHSVLESSSALASQEAAKSLPWQRSWTPAGMSPLQQYSTTEYVP